MSELLFLGTGAADWEIENTPSFLRRNSAALINKELMVDCGGHIFDFAKSTNRADIYDNVTDIIITHNHSDHFCRKSVIEIAQNQKIRVGCDREIMDIIGNHPNIVFVPFEPYKMQKIGNYEILPLLANHRNVIDENSVSFHYIITTPDNKKIFYGLDGAWFLRPSWQIMKKNKFELMILDCTVGDKNDWRFCEHNTIPMLRIMVAGIKSENMISEGGKIIASHFSKGLHPSHEQTKEILDKIDVVTAFDGMNVVF